ncbi:hypothetical protein MRX96_022702 [Rhipicephalus microplus]
MGRLRSKIGTSDAGRIRTRSLHQASSTKQKPLYVYYHHIYVEIQIGVQIEVQIEDAAVSAVYRGRAAGVFHFVEKVAQQAFREAPRRWLRGPTESARPHPEHDEPLDGHSPLTRPKDKAIPCATKGQRLRTRWPWTGLTVWSEDRVRGASERSYALSEDKFQKIVSHRQCRRDTVGNRHCFGPGTPTGPY